MEAGWLRSCPMRCGGSPARWRAVRASYLEHHGGWPGYPVWSVRCLTASGAGSGRALPASAGGASGALVYRFTVPGELGAVRACPGRGGPSIPRGPSRRGRQDGCWRPGMTGAGPRGGDGERLLPRSGSASTLPRRRSSSGATTAAMFPAPGPRPPRGPGGRSLREVLGQRTVGTIEPLATSSVTRLSEVLSVDLVVPPQWRRHGSVS